MQGLRASRTVPLLAGLYFSQGLPFGFFIQAVPVLLRSSGASLETSTLATLLAFPWGLKFLWAPVVDRAAPGRFGRRRKFILPMQAGVALTLAALAFAPPGTVGLWPLCAAFFFVSLASAAQDVATDALAVDVLAAEDRGLGNGVQVAGYRFGMIVGGGLVLMVIEDLGWRASFLGMAALVGLAAVPIVLFREPAAALPAPKAATVPAPGGARPSYFSALRSFLARPDAGKLFALLVIYKAGDALSGGIVRPFLVDRGLSLREIGQALGAIGSVAAVLGALLGGLSLRRLGVKRGLVIFGAIQALAILVYVGVAAGPTPLSAIYAAAALEHFLGGAATAALFASMMGFCRDDSRATDYTVQACVVVAVQGLGGGFSGFLAARAGYSAHFVTALALASLAPFAVLFLWPKRLVAHPG